MVGDERSRFCSVCRKLVYRWWTEFYKRAGDEYPGTGDAIGEMRHWFFRAPWNQIFDLLEFIAQTMEVLMVTERVQIPLRRSDLRRRRKLPAQSRCI